jgi:hypothetical protein
MAVGIHLGKLRTEKEHERRIIDPHQDQHDGTRRSVD